MSQSICRLCKAPLKVIFADLGKTPLANSLLQSKSEIQSEEYFPLCSYVCSECFLVQLPAVTSAARIFREYCYFSSFSESWLDASKKYAEQAIQRMKLGTNSLVIEVGSNDGYLLQFFKEKKIPVLGIEPAVNVANVAMKKGITTRAEFFGVAMAERLIQEGLQADHLVIKNVLAHVPDLHDLIEGIKKAVKKDGVISVEFPYLFNLMKLGQFDTIYHEHFCYFSLFTVEKAFAMHGLKLFDVESLPTHGGSLRIWGCHSESSQQTSRALKLLRETESKNQVNRISTYQTFQNKILSTKEALVSFLRAAKAENKTVAAYGAPAKGNTLLNFCGVGKDDIAYTVDKNPYKQGCLLPGTHIPICAPEKIAETKPDYILILPWNLKEEIVAQLSYVKKWGAQFVVPIPTLEVLSGNEYEISRNAA